MAVLLYTLFIQKHIDIMIASKNIVLQHLLLIHKKLIIRS